MNNNNNDMFDDRLYGQFEYRLLYLVPSLRSDERLTVGVVAATEAGFEVRLVSTAAALDLMAVIIGESGVEQFQFAATELRRRLRHVEDWDAFSMPSELFQLGEITNAFTQDRSGFLSNILGTASLLIRGPSNRASEVIISSGRTRVTSELYNQVSLLNPLIADDLFHKKVSLDKGSQIQRIELPILGNRIFGAPVSLSKADSNQKMRAEAYIAKFRWMQQYLNQRPKIYVLAPGNSSVAHNRRASSSIFELKEVARASNVELAVSESLPELATIVVNDEAA